MSDRASRTVHHLALEAIDEAALPRDRTALDRAAMAELRASIAESGLRLPIEVFPFERARGPHRFGLISGYRRLEAMRALHADERAAGVAEPRFATIPAFIRPAAAIAEQLRAMVEENAVRAPLSAWEEAHVAVAAWRRGIFATLDAAVAGLYPAAARQKRARIRAAAEAVEAFDGLLAAPELLSQRQLMRLAHAVQAGLGEVMRAALETSPHRTPERDWELLHPYLVEAEEMARGESAPTRPGRPRRLLRPRRGLVIRRTRTPWGWPSTSPAPRPPHP